ncbi:hypothetical protein Tsubulata_008597 [Turnera subulata]|uniref:AAA+ ATPase domain-containing protein n=1 Tax=Turnera subulata TaxID=218843 RepID=A0A9Q0F4L1_9ROSI|nr:hypothetical protein Tsubulata_008597 [Turnera subulata]
MLFDTSFACAPITFELSLRRVVRFIEYPLKYKKNVNKLEDKVRELKRAHDKLQRYADDERRNLKTIESDVEEWLSEVENTIQKLQSEFTAREERAKKKCFIGLCPNVKARYQLSRKAEKEREAVDHLQKKQDGFSKIAYETPLVEAISVKGYEAFDSRIAIFKELMDALVDSENFNIIGVYGMGGIGKSTLVKEVARKAEEEKLFDKVVFAAVTRNPDIKKIQASISEKLVLPLNETSSEERRASRLRERLKQEKKILIVIDDLWDALDLEAVGIPSKTDHKGCKILITSRNRDLLSKAMNCHKLISINNLPEDEAWDLFRKIAGDISSNPELQSVAIKVAKKCGGLPLAISAVAKSLKNESNLSVWRNALRELETPSPRNFTGVPAEVYSALELSINRLPSEELKSTFLLCCRMGNEGSFMDLLKYGIGLRLFSDIHTVEAARDRLESLLHQLRASSLLLENDGNDYFSVHDFHKIVGVSIASRDGNVLAAEEEAEVKEWPDTEKLKDLKAIQLHCSISELPEELECPQLHFFHIHGRDSYQKVPDNIFQRMHKLKVLDLTRFSLLSLPPSLIILKNLRTLCLDHCILQDLTIIGELKNLEILSFAGSKFKQLPREVGELTKLKVLDLHYCSDLKVIPPNVISNLSRLEELLLQNSFDEWELEGRNSACLVELNHLSRLTNLEMSIRDVRAIPKNFSTEKLQRFRILIGSSWDWHSSFETSKTLKLKLDTDIRYGSYGIWILIKKAEALYLDEVKGVENLLFELDKEGFPLLKHLHLQNHSGIKYIVNRIDGASSDTAFPILETLFLHNLVSLEKIFHGKFMAQLFGKLETLEVSDCIKLKHLFSLPLVKGLVKLKSIKVTSCNNMAEIIVEENEELASENGEAGMIEFSQLRSISLSSLPQLKNFCSKIKGPLATESHSQEIIDEQSLTSVPTTLFNDKVVFPNLEDLSLESIHIEKIWDGQPSNSILSVRNLTTLVVKGCDLKYLFSSSMVKSLERLEYLQVSECELMEEIIVIGGLPTEESMPAMVFPKLDILELCDLPKLTQFFTGYPIECPLLDQLKISACPRLKTFISSFTSSSTASSHNPLEANSEDKDYDAIQPLFDEKAKFPRLTDMEITRMDNLDMIWDHQLAEGSFCEMKLLTIDQCKKLVHVFPSSLMRRLQRLDELLISNCDVLEEVFQFQGSGNLEFPSLGEINIENCPNMKPICSLFLGGQEQEAVEKGDDQRLGTGDSDMPTPPLLNLEVAFPNLKALGMDWYHIREISHSQHWAEFYAKIIRLELRHFPDDCVVFFFPSNFLRRFINLEILVVTDAYFQEIFPHEQRNLEKVDIEVLPKLKQLVLNQLSKLQDLPKEDSHQCPMFQNLETLALFHCGQLNILFPSSVSFRNLCVLDVLECHGLLYLMTCSAAHCLVHLKRMIITKCEMILEIVATEKNVAEVSVIFPKLEILALNGLPSLTCFHLGKSALILPSLWAVLVKECPKMNIFSAGVTSAPKLEVVDLTEERDKWCWEGNLNDTIQKLFTQTKTEAGDIGKHGPSEYPEYDYFFPSIGDLPNEVREVVQPEMLTLQETEADDIGKHGPSKDPAYEDTSGDLPNQDLVMPSSSVEQNNSTPTFPPASAEKIAGIKKSSVEPEIPKQISSSHDAGASSNYKDELPRELAEPVSLSPRSDSIPSSITTAVNQTSTLMTSASPTKTTSSDKLFFGADTKHISKASSPPVKARETDDKDSRHRFIVLCSQNPSTMSRQALQELQSVTRSLATLPQRPLEPEILAELEELLTAMKLEDDTLAIKDAAPDPVSLQASFEELNSQRDALKEEYAKLAKDEELLPAQLQTVKAKKGQKAKELALKDDEFEELVLQKNVAMHNLKTRMAISSMNTLFDFIVKNFRP